MNYPIQHFDKSPRFTPYQKYKSFSQEWVREIPASWDIRRLKHVAPLRISKLIFKADDGPYVGLEYVESWTGRLLVENQPENIDSVVGQFYAGDVLFGKLRPYLAKAGRPAFHGVCTSEILVLCPTVECTQSYLFYCLISALYIRWIDSLTFGTKMPRVDSERVGCSVMPLPSIEEQNAISNFLDRETTKIDALVEKKEKLIELLKEKRAALITQAVTKGFDPTVPMKDSGVDWLGEIPANWGVKVLKRIGELQSGAGFPDDEQGMTTEHIPFFKVGDMREPGNERDMLEWQHTVSEATARRLRAFVFPPGTIVFAKVGAALFLNRRRLLAKPSCIDNNMMGFMPGKCDPTWAMYWLNGLDMGELANPGAVPSVNEDQMRDTPAIVPPWPEQRAIAAFLDRETAKIDALVEKIQKGITLLREYRSALISAAVTGKIDVRDEVRPQNI